MSMHFAGLRAVPALALAFAATAAAQTIASAATTPRSPQDVLALRQSAVAAAQTLAPAHATKMNSGASVGAAGSPAAPREIFVNPYRAYPPSCLNDGLPFRAYPQSVSDPPAQQQTLFLPGDPAACLPGGNSAECATNYIEQVTVTVWRVACADNKSALLIELDRAQANDGNTTKYPTFPAVEVQQGNNAVFPARLVDEQNTFFTTTFANSPLYVSDIYVFENYFSNGVTQIDYTKALTVTLDNTIAFAFPDYAPNQYGAAGLSLPISGHMSSNWFDPLHGGEGMLTQVFDNNDGQTRTFTAAWYTFDQLGLPFWLYAQGSTHIGDRTTGPVATYYETSGCFAGVGCGSATAHLWGTMTFSFPDCGHMTFSYNGQTDAQTNGPNGSGNRNWLRIANINGLFCD